MSFIFAPGGGGLSIPYSETQGDDTVAADFDEYSVADAAIGASAQLVATGLQASGGGGPDVDIDSSQLRPIGVVGPAGDNNRMSEFDLVIDRTTDGRQARLTVDSAGGSSVELIAAGGASSVRIDGQTNAAASAGGGAAPPATVLTFVECIVDGNAGRIAVFAP